MVRKILVTNLKSFQVFHEKSIIAKVTIPGDIIAPSCGINWRKDPLHIVSQYYEWAQGKNDGSEVIIYGTSRCCQKKGYNSICENFY
ncbi:MAG: hypothetical protein OIN83_06920 [Candidatus Methanoperedens sp.]|nr:hypothetical protein [Candidatus Methanoperedens sp.]